MEQSHFSQKILLFLVLSLTSAIFMGCKTKEKQPELLDPIYQDLKSTLGEYSKSVEDTQKEILTLEQEINTYEPNTKELHMGRKKLKEARNRLRQAKQMELYYEIRLERRRVEDRKAYSYAFENDQVWPDPGEYSAYLANKRLRNSRRQWDARVPKLKNRVEEYQNSRAPADASSAPE